MANELFYNPDRYINNLFGELRTIKLDGNIYFCLVDIMRSLNMDTGNSNDLVNKIDNHFNYPNSYQLVESLTPRKFREG